MHAGMSVTLTLSFLIFISFIIDVLNQIFIVQKMSYVETIYGFLSKGISGIQELEQSKDSINM